MAVLECHNVSMSYGKNTVLNNLSFSINAGDYLCIVGENGAGKSTLLKGLLGLKKPSQGHFCSSDGLKSTDIGYLPQQSPAQKDFPASVMEVVLSGTLNSHKFSPFYTKADKNRANEMIKTLGVEDIKDECYRELSGGQQQRVLLARALCAAKKVILLDEPTTGLDPLMTKDFYKLISQINIERGITVIMVSHDINSAVNEASHILYLGNNSHFFGTAQEYRESELGKKFLGGEPLA